MDELTINRTVLSLVQGDITERAEDAIVNAANSTLMGGGGVDGAIHSAGGPTILEECKGIVERQGQLPTGKAVITTGGRLKAKYVIHTVGPVWRGGQYGEKVLLASAYNESLKLASGYGLSSIAFPSISTGAYRYPLYEAATIALKAVSDYLTTNETSLRRVIFVLFSERAFDAYASALKLTT